MQRSPQIVRPPTAPRSAEARRQGSLVRPLVVVGLIVSGLASPPAYADRVDDLGQALLTDPSWRVRLQAAFVLGRLRDLRAVNPLVRALSDENQSVRAQAAQVLGDLGDGRATAALDRAQRDPDPLVRSQAHSALARLAATPPTTAPVGNSDPYAVARQPHPAARPAPGALHVEVGGIGSKQRTSPELKQRLREFITRELERTPGITLDGAPSKGFLIDTAITSLSRRTTGSFIEVSCEVSLIVGKLPSHAMVMMTSGGATVQAPRSIEPAREKALQVDALEGAVHGAQQNLLAFLKTQR